METDVNLDESLFNVVSFVVVTFMYAVNCYFSRLIGLLTGMFKYRSWWWMKSEYVVVVWVVLAAMNWSWHKDQHWFFVYQIW